MRALLLVLALVAPLAVAQEEAVRLDPAPIDPRDLASLQSGARTFVNYCLNCHSAGMMRYVKLEEIGLTEQQIKDNLLFTGDKIGDLMNVALTKKDAKDWLAAVPPDLSVIARAKGADWLYTYLRSFYRDTESATGWNNMVEDRVAMPNVLWTLSGQQTLVPQKFKSLEQAGKDGDRYVLKTIKTEVPGKLSQLEYDVLVRDLVNFMTWMSEPNQLERKQTGYVVMLVLLVLLVFAYLLYKEFWKDVH